ncbi:hypothetical protein CTH_0715 [Carboxydocella thermautotrophica]|nr:hypothetical protein CTH_0715 [Carboxydocella thermautotrophica]
MASEKKVSEVISIFKCAKDRDIENFIKEKAIIYEKKAKSRTYLVFDEEASLEGEFKLLGYFALALQSLKIPEGTSVSQIRRLDGLYSRKGDGLITEIPAFLIGQLGKNDLYKDDINGDKLMKYALAVISRAQEIVGGRIVFLECQDKPKLIDFYSRNGFKIFRKDPLDNLVQMIRLIN